MKCYISSIIFRNDVKKMLIENFKEEIATIWYVNFFTKLKKIFKSKKNNDYVQEKSKILLNDLKDWKNEIMEKEKKLKSKITVNSSYFITDALFQDIETSLNSIINIKIEYDYVLPYLVNQNYAENWFSLHRELNGGLTAYEYCCSNKSLFSHHLLNNASKYKIIEKDSIFENKNEIQFIKKKKKIYEKKKKESLIFKNMNIIEEIKNIYDYNTSEICRIKYIGGFVVKKVIAKFKNNIKFIEEIFLLASDNIILEINEKTLNCFLNIFFIISKQINQKNLNEQKEKFLINLKEKKYSYEIKKYFYFYFKTFFISNEKFILLESFYILIFDCICKILMNDFFERLNLFPTNNNNKIIQEINNLKKNKK
jgi:hypothetical protein